MHFCVPAESKIMLIVALKQRHCVWAFFLGRPLLRARFLFMFFTRVCWCVADDSIADPAEDEANHPPVEIPPLALFMQFKAHPARGERRLKRRLS